MWFSSPLSFLYVLHVGLLEPGVHVNPGQGNKKVWAKMLTGQWKLGKLSANTWDMQTVFWTQLLQGQMTFLQGLQNLTSILLGFSRCFYRLKKAMPIKALARWGGCKSCAVLLQSSGTLGRQAFLAPTSFPTRRAIQMDGHKDRPADKPSCVLTTLARYMQTEMHTGSLRIKQTNKHTYKLTFLQTCKLTFIHTYSHTYNQRNKQTNIHAHIHTYVHSLHTVHTVFNIPRLALIPALHSIH